MNTKQNLTTASKQWQFRPADQRFWTLAELYERTKRYAEESRVHTLSLSECAVIPTDDGDMYLQGPQGGAAQFQHYSFGQIAGHCRAPAEYLRGLPSSLAAQNLNHGLAKIQGKQTLMFHKNGGLHLRCVTSDKYSRIWNYEIAELALALEEGEGWRTPPARSPQLDPGECRTDARGLIPTRIATEADVLRKSAHPNLGIKVGDTISPAGLYASDHDCFIFQVNEDIAIEAGGGETLYRGVFWSNSEVGQARWRGTMFLYDTICGNHIVWGARIVAEISIQHTGKAREAFSEAMATVSSRALRAASEDEDRIRTAKSYQLGERKESIVELIFRKPFGLSKAECTDAYTLAVRHEDEHGNNPHSAWGYAAGLTRLSQQGYADDRVRMDRAAGRILEMAF